MACGGRDDRVRRAVATAKDSRRHFHRLLADPTSPSMSAALPPILESWFAGRGWAPRSHQRAMLAAARRGDHALLVAPTGAGKTLAGFLPTLADAAQGSVEGLHTLYISPLKALAVDIQRNLKAPIDEIGLDLTVETRTGDTLCDPDHPVILEKMEFPEPVIEIAIEPKSKADQEKLGVALAKLAAEDPSFRVKTDEESGQTIISGMGELHLDILVDRMRREFTVEANIGKPQVAYRETIKNSCEIEGKFVRQSGGRGQYGHVWIKFEPAEDSGELFLERGCFTII